MGFWDKLIKRRPRNTKHVSMLNGYTPIFSQFGQDIYTSDVVQQAVSCIVTEMKKLNPLHVVQKDRDSVPATDKRVQRILDLPNELMTTPDFLEKMIWMLFLNYNAFAIPTYYELENKRIYTGLYPVQPTQVDFIQDATNQLYIKMRFANNYETSLKYSDVIHMRMKYSVNEFMGGNAQGQPDNDTLLKTLQLNQDLLDGVSAAMRSSFTINGVVKYNTMLDDGKTEAALKELEAKLKANESGFLPLDLKADYIPMKKEIKMVDKDTLEFIDSKILRHFGVSIPILSGDYTTAQYASFYQKTLEPLVISLGKEFTRVFFSDRERSFGNEIVFYPEELIFLTPEQKLEAIRMMGDSGSLYENEKRRAFGLMPLPELEGIRMQSLNYVNVDIAAQYQLKGKGKTDGA